MTNEQTDRSLIHLCLGDGGEGVRQMIGDVGALAELFQRGDTGPANEALARMAQDLGALIVLVESLREPAATFGGAALPSAADVERMATTLESVVTAQVAQDWPTVSDILQYDLGPALADWLTQFEAATAAFGA